MLDNRIHYAQLAAEDRLRQHCERAAIGRASRRIFQLAPRRPARVAGTR
jgi:hypothetical protein